MPADADQSSISAVIKAAVQQHLDKGGTLYELAAKAKLRDEALYRWWREGRDIRASTIDKLAISLGVTARQSKRRLKPSDSQASTANSR